MGDGQIVLRHQFVFVTHINMNPSEGQAVTPLTFRKINVLRGPNVWANFPVLEVWVELGELEYRPSDTIPGFNERVMAWLPSMIEHRCSVGERGGFFERMRRGTYMGHILETRDARAANAGGQ